MSEVPLLAVPQEHSCGARDEGGLPLSKGPYGGPRGGGQFLMSKVPP